VLEKFYCPFKIMCILTDSTKIVSKIFLMYWVFFSKGYSGKNNNNIQKKDPNQKHLGGKMKEGRIEADSTMLFFPLLFFLLVCLFFIWREI
jgi:hypothetical protein